MASRSELTWEFFRKMFHLVGGLLIVVGYTLLLNYFSDRVAILAMTAILLLLLELEYIRLEHRPKIVSIIDNIFRSHEKDNISSAAFMVISCIICFSAFGYWVAFVALFMTVFGDFFAALVGRAFGKTKIVNNKTVAGTLAGLLANLTVGILILPNFVLLVTAMAFVATFVELITNKLEDNLTVPLFAGFIGQMIVYYSDMVLPPIDFTFLGLF